VFLWFWLVVLAVVTAISILYHLVLATIPSILSSWLKRKIRSTAQGRAAHKIYNIQNLK